MPHVSFDVSDEDGELIEKIALRAAKELFKPQGIRQSTMDTEMDLAATIAQGCPLRLQELLDADKFNFAHDVGGIYMNINRETGTLANCFLPRFARV